MRRAHPPALVVLTVVIATVALAGCSPQAARTTPSTPASAVPTPTRQATGRPVAQTWLGYHNDQARTGAVAADPPTPAAVSWSADLGGAVYGEPVVADDRVVAATETDRVVALAADTGKLLWSVSLGAPLTNVRATAGCGDIDPLGITSTPVIEPRTGTVYVVGEVDDGGGAVHHQLEGISLATGSVTLSENVDPPLPADEKAVNLLQRASLALGNGRVYIGYGGNDGDCGSYHGWVVGVEETGAPAPVAFEVASDGEGGAIWESGGAPAIDSHGDVYVSTGNANPFPSDDGPDPKQYTESVVELTPDLKPVAAFKDTVAGGDEDLATGNPVLLPNAQLFAVGKTDVGYVLETGSLAEVGAITGVCDSDPDGGPAYDASTDRIFVPCRDGGIQQVDLATGALGPRLAGANGAPIVIGDTLWAAEYPAGTLSEFSIPTGARLQTIPLGSSVPFFTTPSYALGRVYVGTESGIAAVGAG